jgi:hypothetical protein
MAAIGDAGLRDLAGIDGVVALEFSARICRRRSVRGF